MNGLQPTPTEGNQKKVETIEAGKKGTGASLSVYAFDPTRKALFLELASKWFPDLSRICEAVGISRQSYYNHIHKDAEFARAVEAVRLARIDRIEGKVFEAAEDNKNFLHQAMVLRAHRPELYDRAKVVKIEGLQMNPQQAQERLGAVSNAVDAEIVKTYLDKKQRRDRSLRLKHGSKAGTPEKQGGGL